MLKGRSWNFKSYKVHEHGQIVLETSISLQKYMKTGHLILMDYFYQALLTLHGLTRLFTCRLYEVWGTPSVDKVAGGLRGRSAISRKQCAGNEQVD